MGVRMAADGYTDAALGELTGQSFNWQLRAAVSGQSNAALAALLAAFKPHVALFVGIVGGGPARQRQGSRSDERNRLTVLRGDLEG
jgi:hypothetical protein